MAEEKKSEEGQKLTIQEPPKGNPLLVVVLLLNTIGVGVVGYLQFQAHMREKNKESVYEVVKRVVEQEVGAENGVQPEDEFGKRKDKEGLLLPLDGFTANLAQGDGPRRYVRLSTVLKFSADSREEEFKARKPQIRDSIISILNSKRPGDLLKKEGKEYLKEEIKAAINAFLVDGKVIDVYYVGFQIN